MFRSLSSEAKKIWKIAKVVQGVNGFNRGLSFFIWGPLFYEKLSQLGDPKLGITFTSLLLGIRMTLIAFLEVPTGAIGDAIGRKWTVVWSFICRMFFYIFLALVPLVHSISLVMTFGVLAMVCFSFGYTFFSGTFSAWCVDSLREKAPNVGYEFLFSKSYIYESSLVGIGGVIGVLLYLWHFPSFSFLIAAASCVFCVVFCLGEMEEPKNLQFLEHRKVSFAVITKRMGEILGVGFQVFRQSKIILSLVFIYASYMFVLNIVDYLWPVYLRSRAPIEVQPIYWIALIIVVQFCNIVGSKFLVFKNNAKESKRRNIILRRRFVGACLFATLPILALSWLTHKGLDAFWFFALAILPVEFAYGIVAPCFETLINNYIPDNHAQERATIMSFGSLGRSLLIMILSIPAGGSSGARTTVGWAIPAFLLLISALIGNFILKRAQRKAPSFDEKVEPVQALAENS